MTRKLRLQLITRGVATAEVTTEVAAFLAGGGRWVQLRMKEAPAEAVVEAGRAILPLCRSHSAVLIINDSPELALRIGADGVHLGLHDASPAEARALLGRGAIIGRTANTFADIEQAAGYGVDYVGLGPLRHTTTKKNLSPLLGVEGIRRILAGVAAHGIRLPVAVIGGITAADIPALAAAGARCFAVSGAIGHAADPQRATEQFLDAINALR